MPTTGERGYGAPHQRERARWQATVDVDGYICTRCSKYRPPGTPFHLDHADDRGSYLGAACVPCNTGAGGRKARANERRQRSSSWRSRIW